MEVCSIEDEVLELRIVELLFRRVLKPIVLYELELKLAMAGNFSELSDRITFFNP